MKQVVYGLVFAISIFFAGCSEFSIDVKKPGENDTETPIELTHENSESGIALKKTSPAESYYEDVTRKTLFNPDRVFVEIPSEDPGMPTPTPGRQAVELPDLELVGTLKTSGDQSFAFIKNSTGAGKTKTAAVLKYTLGQWIGDYLISKIEASRVTLMKGDEVAVIKLKPSAKPAGRPTRTNPRMSPTGSTAQGSTARCGSERRSDSGSQRSGRDNRDKGSSVSRGRTDGRFDAQSMEEMEKIKTLEDIAAYSAVARQECGR